MIIVNTREMYSISKQFVASKSLIDEQRWSTPLGMGLLYSIQQTAFHATSILSYIPIILSSLVQQILRIPCFLLYLENHIRQHPFSLFQVNLDVYSLQSSFESRDGDTSAFVHDKIAKKSHDK